MHIVNCKIGADVITGPLSAIYGLLENTSTDIGAQFVAGFRRWNKMRLNLEGRG
jgi:transaldolase